MHFNIYLDKARMNEWWLLRPFDALYVSRRGSHRFDSVFEIYIVVNGRRNDAARMIFTLILTIARSSQTAVKFRECSFCGVNHFDAIQIWWNNLFSGNFRRFRNYCCGWSGMNHLHRRLIADVVNISNTYSILQSHLITPTTLTVSFVTNNLSLCISFSLSLFIRWSLWLKTEYKQTIKVIFYGVLK